MTKRTIIFSFLCWLVFCAAQSSSCLVKTYNTESSAKETVNWEQSRWIGYTEDNRTEAWSGREVRKQNQTYSQIQRSFPSPLMRKTFRLTKDIISAHVVVCGLGLYELYINGAKVGDRVLDPAQTTYNKRAFFVEHKVSRLLQQGKNAIGLMLGNGFFGQNIALSSGLKYGEPRAILILKIQFKDGSSQSVLSNGDWKASKGPILFDNIYLGETYDARQEYANWTCPGYDDSGWKPVTVMDAPTDNLVKQHLEPMRKIRSIEPIAVLPAETGYILDMGQNMTGWLQMKVTEPKGTVIRMRFAELLMPDKRNIDPASTGVHVTGGTQTDIYICNGKGDEKWEPRFTYHGFRYVQIEGLSNKPDLKNFTGCLVRTDVERIGTFECSDSLMNKFYKTSMWTIEDNLQGLLSDCPHRERCAWMGDIYAVAEAASYNFDMEKMWQKLSADIETVVGVSPAHFKDDFPYDPRTPSNIAVGKRLCLQARPDWGATTVMLPWYTFLYYGNVEIVKTAWEMMVGWMGYVDEKVQKDGIIYGGYGDWCPPGGNSEMHTPPALTSTALYYQSLVVMNKMGLVLKETDAAQNYAEKAEFVKKAFNKKFFDKAKNSYGSQTGNAFALFSNLVAHENEKVVADNLAELIMEKNKGHYATGIFGHRPLYTVLNDFGHAGVSRHLWTISDYPSLGFMTEKHNLTTWPEVPNNWSETEPYPRNSFNHPMHSGFAASFHESLGGIRPDTDHPGFKLFFLKPCFIPDVEWVNTSHKSPFGIIKSSWKRRGNIITWWVSVPEGSLANVELPQFAKEKIKLNNDAVESNVFKLPCGRYTITIETINL